MKKKVIIFLSLILLGTVIVLAYNRLTGIEKQGAQIEATGIIEATGVNIAPKISEKIEWLCCREGDLVKQGDLLIRLDKRERDDEKATYDTTEARLQSALAKKQGIKAELTTVQEGLKAAGAQLNSAKATIGEAEARLRLIETQARYTEISSPIGGVIAYKSFEAGEMVPAGKTIYTIYDLKNIWGRVDIEETDIGRIKLGGRAMIMIAGLAGRGSEGEVIEIGREAEFATQRDVTRGRQDIKTFRVKVAIKGPINEDDGLLKPGMTVVIRFPAVSP